MTNSQIESEFTSLPATIREKVERAIGDARVALKLQIGKAMSDPAEVKAHEVTTAGRGGAAGLKSGEVSELTVIVPLKADGAARLRKLFGLIDGNLFGAGKVGTLHNMRFVFLDDDTKLLFATAYDGEWDPYIDDFATRIPDMMDYIFGNVEGWPGISSPDVKDFILGFQVPASAWYVAHPNLTVAEAERLTRQDKTLHTFLDQLN